MSKLGIMFVDDKIKNYKEIENEIWEKEQELIEEAQNKLGLWLAERGLKIEMGIVIEKQSECMTFKIYGEKSKISPDLMDAITVYMDSDIREAVQYDLAPCKPEEFLEEYIRRDPDFTELLEHEFSIEVEE